MRNRPPPKKVTQRTSGRRRTKVDYTQYELPDDPPTPPKRKRKVDLKRKPSATRMAAEKYKTKSANTPRPIRTPVSGPVTTSGEAVASTSRTITTPATQEETENVLKELASMDTLPDDDPADDDTKLPIAPPAPEAPPTLPIVADTLDTNVTAHTPQGQPLATNGGSVDIKPIMLPRVIGTAVKVEKPADTLHQKRVFKTVEYKLKRKYTRQRKFSCVGCKSNFNTQKELNDHFRTSHPTVKCDLYEKLFDTPAAMMQHKYKHYEYMYECTTCSRGFQFASQLQEHNRVHQSLGDWVCFKPKCGKRFKRESELNTHLVLHNEKQHQCDSCLYKNTDPRNLQAHQRRHSEALPFKCALCGKGFKWIQQRIHHLKSGTCPEQNKE